MRIRTLVAAIAAVCCLAVAVQAQVQQGTIEGTVVHPDGSPADAIAVTLVDTLGATIAVAQAQAGRFRLTNVAPGVYSLRADAPPLHAVIQRITITGALPIRVDLRLAAAASEQLVVRAAERGSESVVAGVTIAGETLRRGAVQIRSRGLQQAIATTPGWSTEDNGLLHVRGVDDGFLYVVDGVPVYERLDGLFGVAPDPAIIDSVNVLTGYIPAEFGFKSGGVIDVRSVSSAANAWAGVVDAGGGTYATGDFSAVAGGPLGRSVSVTAGSSGERSSRFLDPVHPENLHNAGGTLSGGGRIGWTRTADGLTGVAGFGRSHFDVPHGEEQEEAAQDQRQRLRSHWQTASWQRVWSARTVSQLAAYHRGSSAALLGSGRDTPLFTHADRSLRRVGALASVTRQAGRHLIKFGGEASRLDVREAFSFGVTDVGAAEAAGLSPRALAYTVDRPFRFGDAAVGTMASIYVQDSIRATPSLAVDIGLRGDWTRLAISDSHWSPRGGLAYHVPATQTTVRASFGRFFQPPQPENLLLASSPQARALSPFADDTHDGGAELRSERQTAIDVGVAQMLTRQVRLEATYWRRRIKDAADPNVFFGTTIVFPNAVARGRASGFDVRLEMPRTAEWSWYVNYSHARVMQFGPITGGLFLEDDVIEIREGTAFTPDHDQRHAAAGGVTYSHRSNGLSWSITGRYESGTPLEVDEDDYDELDDRAGAELVDFARGRVKPRQVYDAAVTQRILHSRRVEVDLRAAVVNLTGARWAYNFGNPFSGTHFGPGRTLKVGLRATFR